MGLWLRNLTSRQRRNRKRTALRAALDLGAPGGDRTVVSMVTPDGKVVIATDPASWEKASEEKK